MKLDILLGKMAADHIAHIEVVYENGYQVLVKVQGAIGFGLLREILWHM